MTFEPDWVVPPGASINNLLNKLEIEKDEIAESLNLTVIQMNQLISGKQRITSEIAQGLANILGGSVNFWLKRDEIYVSELDRLNMDSNVEVESWIKSLPLNYLSDYGWVERDSNPQKFESRILAFFDCDSFSEWKAINSDRLEAVLFRSSKSYEKNEINTLVWKWIGEKQALERTLPKFNRERFIKVLPSVKQISSLQSPKMIIERIRERIEPTGVTVTTAKAPPGCRACGATWLLESGNPLIHLSFRHRSNDHFWFTFFHEAAHIALNHNEHQLIRKNLSTLDLDAKEIEANRLAASIIIPDEIWKGLIQSDLSDKTIINYARKAGIAVGVIVGQLQRAKILKFNTKTYLKRYYKWGNGGIFPIRRRKK